METDSALNLLLIHDNIDEANRLVSLLRNANYKVDPQHAKDEEELRKRIQERNWDLAFIQFAAQSVSARTVFHQIRRLNKDIPAILIGEGYDSVMVVEGLRMGASDVVPMDEDQHLLQTVSRTLYNLEQRRSLRYWKRRYSDAEERCERLLQNSRDAIAIVQEGTYLTVNDSYANLFGYLDPDGMIMLPVIDTIESSKHAAFRKFLVPLSGDDAWDREIVDLSGLKPDGSTFNVSAEISQVDYQGEPALQFLVAKEFLSPLDSSREERDSVDATPSINAIRVHWILEQITMAIRKAARAEEDSILHYFSIDRFDEMQQEIGIKTAEEIAVKVAQFLQNRVGSQDAFGRIKEDSFVLLREAIDADTALEDAEKLCREIVDEIIELDDNKTYNITLSAGLSVVSEATSTAEGCIDRCLKAIEQLRGTNSSDNAGNGVQLFEAVFEPTMPDLADTDIIRFGKQLLEKKMLDIAFQPIVPLHGARAEYYEVLMRPRHDAFPKNLPEDFIARVFKTDIAKDIDRWVILEAIKELGEKQNTHPNTKLFVNISSASLCDDQFIAWLKVALKAAGIDPHSLIFQLREIDVGRHLKRAVEMVESLKKFRSGTALTHFGLSINPMQVFKKLDVDFVKLDMLVVEKARKEKAGMDSITEIIKTLREEDQCIVVPFVESPAVIPTLWQHGVHYIQGHYIQEPDSQMDYDFTEDE